MEVDRLEVYILGLYEVTGQIAEISGVMNIEFFTQKIKR